MSKLIICRGLPASGKTTWATSQLAAETYFSGGSARKVCRVNRDDIRASIHNGIFIKGVTEEVVIAVRDASIQAALRKGWDVISDDTNLKSRNVIHLLKIANREGAEVEFKDFTDVPHNECVRRDEDRAYRGLRSVGAEVIYDAYERFLRGRQLPLPIPELKSEPTFAPVEHGTSSAVIADIDGTLAHNNGHRGFYEYDKVLNDEPKIDVIDAVRSMYFSFSMVFVLSGRSDECRDITKEWLYRNVFWDARPPYTARETWLIKDGETPDISRRGIRLLMRKEGDHRDDAVVKYELYRDYIAPNFDVKMVFDDRDRVVRMWRSIGLTCAQVGYGDF